MTIPRDTPSAVLADLADALARARAALPADRIALPAWRVHAALDDAEACLAELDRWAATRDER
jgi:hypothetical protein